MRTRWQQKLGHDGVRRLEVELMASVNPDAQSRGDCTRQAMTYLKWRLKQMKLGLKAAGPKCLAWFFCTPILYRQDVALFRGDRYVRFMGQKARQRLNKVLEF